jgi:uncharacterized membrane protein YhaH (DUF805 family)
MLQMIGRPWWWMLLMLVPFVNIVVSVVIALDTAKVFGKSAVFGVVGLWLLSPIGMMMLAFGDAKYRKPEAGGGTSAPSPSV